ncbi:ribosomal protein L24, putative [Trichomonas vaginalis G3]|uniref:Ribosomal protein L24, putative n=1 Tax=Trichomonas vaginalis (strain ATCC PRA-98 / G3) TaxID=412133 RepID=A2DKF2_TRIV3|nr:regulation of translation involved in cellular response to UV [Trichomonas vaginalis G3]EAY19129.1 ribosomal protein L24, putative [Trichomonas vaginalis G3]KAI5490426.1 regulation of translation involved in cellular response to UV [Trichomonas vaginalis G3]5XY3_Y Chain Y, Ribosomal protein L24, putative [Trichomonas vaginalis]|eukprot:XP_001580115.1 ribosomal protein L24 [Trichomonas vaginalis G3]
MVKTNPFVSSQARKVRKSYFNAKKDAKHVAMSAPLSKELQEANGIKRLPIRRDDEVMIFSGRMQNRTGKVTAVKLSEMRIYVDTFTTEKINGQAVSFPVHPSNVVITKLKMDKARKNLIELRRLGRDQILAKLGHKKQ